LSAEAAAGVAPGTAARLGRIAFFCAAALFLGLATWANLDLKEDRASLFMDELIVHNGTRAILDAPDRVSFWKAVLDGGDHRYGRVLWNVCALTSALPYRIWGAPGLIVAMRTTLTLCLLGAYAILACVFFRSWPFRALALGAMCALPFSGYYFTMPKPEPLQILFYALFLYRARKVGFRFGWHWLFMGLAFGAKISALTATLACGGLALVVALATPSAAGQGLRELRALALAVVSFLAGWVIAVPIMASFDRALYGSYWHWTFAMTTHGLDDASVTPLTWVRSFFDGSLFWENISPGFVAAVTALATFALLGYFATRMREKHSLLEWLQDDVLVLCSLAFVTTAPIVAVVKRLWGIYLHGGMVFAVLAVLVAVERLWRRYCASPVRSRVAGALSWGMVVPACAFFAISPAAEVYARNAHRTRSEEYLWQAAVFQETKALLDEVKGGRGDGAPANKPLEVLYDPFLFLPESSAGYHIETPWGAFRRWEERVDVIVLTRREQMRFLLSEPLSAALPESKANYQDFLSAQEVYRRMVREPTPRFALFRILHGEAYVFVNSRLRLPQPAASK
jgi:hypothetical protein